MFEIQKNGVDLKKLVIGKPGSAADATNGFMSAATLATCVKQAKAKGWNAGLMFFEVSPPSPFPASARFSSAFRVCSTLLSCVQFPEANAAFLKTAKGSAFH